MMATTWNRLTEWGKPTELVEIVVQGAIDAPAFRVDGDRVLFPDGIPHRKLANVTYLEWCKREAKRLGGRVAKQGQLIAVVA